MSLPTAQAQRDAENAALPKEAWNDMELMREEDIATLLEAEDNVY